MQKFGMLTQVDLCEIWIDEPRHFTPWLVKNIKALGETLGMDLEIQQREAKVGNFSLDILAKDLGSNQLVVIENQLTQTDHDHLGKILTYTSGFDAHVIVWIAKEIRDEHRQALEWLNQNTGQDIYFFGVVVEVLKIDNSDPAFRFNPVVTPNEWSIKNWPRGENLTPRAKAYKNFFQVLIDELRTKHRFTNAKKGQPQSWYAFATGFSGVVYSSCFAQGGNFRVELYIDFGDKDKNKRLFDHLEKDREEIELEIGNGLNWERLNDKRASRISIVRAGEITTKNKELDEIRTWAITNLLQFKETFSPRLKSLLH